MFGQRLPRAEARCYSGSSFARFPQDDNFGWWELFLAAEAVDEAEVDAEVVLEGAAEGGAHVVGCDAEGEVGEEVESDVGSDGECGAGVGGGPHAEVGGEAAFGVAVEFADGGASQGEEADADLLPPEDAVGGAGHEGVLGDLRPIADAVGIVADLGVAVVAAQLTGDAELPVEGVGEIG